MRTFHTHGSIKARMIELGKSPLSPIRTRRTLGDSHSRTHYSSMVLHLTDALWFFKRHLGIPHWSLYANWP